MLTIRDANVEDVPAIFDMLVESAIDQGFPDDVRVTETDLVEDGFGKNPRFYTLIGEIDGSIAGMALYFFTYSTWVSRNGLYLEDICVRKNFRGQGVARGLMIRLAQIALANGCGRFQWVVHNANDAARQLYRSIGATTLESWFLMTITGEELGRLASSTSES